MMKLKRIVFTLIVILACSILPGVKADAATRWILVDKVWTEPEVVEPGQQFQLKFTLRNISDKTLEKIGLSLISQEGKNTLSGFSPVGTTNFMYCESLDKGKSADLSIGLIADSGLKAGAFNIIVGLNGKEKYGSDFEDSKIIGLVVANKPVMVITSMNLEDAKPVNNKKLMLDFVNTGKGALSNVMVTVTEGEKKTSKYYGAVEPTDENSYDQIIAATQDMKGKVEITYTDELNRTGSIAKEFEIKAPVQETPKEAVKEKKEKGFFAGVGRFFKRLFGLGG